MSSNFSDLALGHQPGSVCHCIRPHRDRHHVSLLPISVTFVIIHVTVLRMIQMSLLTFFHSPSHTFRSWIRAVWLRRPLLSPHVVCWHGPVVPNLRATTVPLVVLTARPCLRGVRPAPASVSPPVRRAVPATLLGQYRLGSTLSSLTGVNKQSFCLLEIERRVGTDRPGHFCGFIFPLRDPAKLRSVVTPILASLPSVTGVFHKLDCKLEGARVFRHSYASKQSMAAEAAVCNAFAKMGLDLLDLRSA